MAHKTLRIDPDTRDLVFDAGSGELSLVEDAESIAQAVRLTVQVYLGEWFLDKRHGTDYARIMGMHPTNEEIEDILRAAIYQEPEVRHIEELTASRNQRSVKVAFRGKLRSGDTLNLEVST